MQDRGVSEAGASPSNPSPGAHSVERLEPTTLRLTARHLHFSGLLSIAIYCLVSVTCKSSSSQANCGDYPQLPTILKESPHKIPHSELRTDFRLRSSRLDAISNTDRLRLMRSYSTASALPSVCSGNLSSGLFLPITASSVPRGARMRWEGLLQPGASLGTGAGRRHRARILQARPSSDRGQCGDRKPQWPPLQALPHLSPGEWKGWQKQHFSPAEGGKKKSG